jgi:hypothetical protein
MSFKSMLETCVLSVPLILGTLEISPMNPYTENVPFGAVVLRNYNKPEYNKPKELSKEEQEELERRKDVFNSALVSAVGFYLLYRFMRDVIIGDNRK